jgi:leucyl aminopeptidase
MDISLVATPLAELETPLLGIFVPNVDQLPAAAGDLDRALNGALSREIGRGRLRAGKGDVCSVSGGASGPERIVLVGLGPEHDGHAEALRNAGAKIAAATRASRADSASLLAPGDDADGETLMALVEGFNLGAYRYDRFKSRDGHDDDIDVEDTAEDHPSTFESLTIVGADDKLADAIDRVRTVTGAVNWARDLTNAPANYLTPELLAFHAEQLAARHEHLTYRSLDRNAIEKAGMGLLSAVGQGSANEPRLIILEWNPPADKDRADSDRLALIGKAVTFDTGGISIKPSAGMAEMKMDKGGGCAVLGSMRAIAELNVPRRVLAIVGSTENMPGGRAYKPGDVITAYDGTNVEVTNTDAEGRLVLGDAIGYARELGCGKIVELSTLTGAMVVALGHHFAGCVARDGELTDSVLASAKRTGDHAWHMPMHDAYKPGLKSDCADMANSGPRWGGSLYAGLFLEHFAKDTPYVHLDVAGSAMLPKPTGYHPAKGASGWGVRLLADLAATY